MNHVLQAKTFHQFQTWVHKRLTAAPRHKRETKSIANGTGFRRTYFDSQNQESTEEYILVYDIANKCSPTFPFMNDNSNLKYANAIKISTIKGE